MVIYTQKMVLTFSIIGELPNILDTPVLIGIYTRILQPGSCLNSKEEDTVIINEILVRAASDPEFRNQLIRQPSNVLAHSSYLPLLFLTDHTNSLTSTRATQRFFHLRKNIFLHHFQNLIIFSII